MKRENLKSISEKEYQRHLKNRRHREEEEAQRRLNIAREGFLRSQEYLRQLLQEKDDRKRKLIRTIHKQKVLLEIPYILLKLLIWPGNPGQRTQNE